MLPKQTKKNENILANIKSKSRLDIGVIIFHDLANVAYVTTKSKTFAACCGVLYLPFKLIDFPFMLNWT